MRAPAAALALLALVVLSVAPASAQRAYRIVPGYDIPGNDIPSKGKDGKPVPYTKYCQPVEGYKGKTGFDAFQLVCDETPGCVAFTAPYSPDGCAYLKKAGKRANTKEDAKWIAVTSQEKPRGDCKSFSPMGGPCMADVWVDEPICCGGNHVKCVNGKCGSGFPSGR